MVSMYLFHLVKEANGVIPIVGMMYSYFRERNIKIDRLSPLKDKQGLFKQFAYKFKVFYTLNYFDLWKLQWLKNDLSILHSNILLS